MTKIERYTRNVECEYRRAYNTFRHVYCASRHTETGFLAYEYAKREYFTQCDGFAQGLAVGMFLGENYDNTNYDKTFEIYWGIRKKYTELAVQFANEKSKLYE